MTYCRYCSEKIPYANSVCPKCGYNNGANTMEAVLTEMLRIFGKEALCKRSDMVSVFWDLAPAIQNERLMLKYLYEVDGPAELLASIDRPAAEAQKHIDLVLSRLKSLFISEEVAREICHRFLSVLGDSRPAKNKCGENACWELVHGILTISGSGAMGAYALKSRPWHNQRSNIRAAVIKDGITSIGNYAFWDCSSLFSVAIPDSVREVGEYAFADCFSLPSITVPDGVKEIGSSAFRGCRSLSTATIPASVKEIGSFAFEGCRRLTICTPEGSQAQSYAQANRIPLELAKRAGQEKIISNEASREVNIWSRSVLGGSSVPPRKKCGENAYWDLVNGVLTIGGSGAMREYDTKSRPWHDQRDSIKAVVINAGITSIGNYAFWGCSSLSSITIPDSVREICSSAFWGCKSLSSITIPASVRKIGPMAFSDCESLISITIPDGVREISDDAFRSCRNLTSIMIPASVTRIGPFAFEGCRRLTICTPEGSQAQNYAQANRIPLEPAKRAGQKEKISNEASREVNIWSRSVLGGNSVPPRKKCGENAYWELVNGVLTIGGRGAMGEYSLNSRPWHDRRGDIRAAVIKDGITSIGNYAFWGCSSLSSITIPDSVREIGKEAFWGCSGLSGITIPDNVREIGECAFVSCSSLTDITIPGKVGTIRDRAFIFCSSLSSITIQDGITSIENYAFRGCSSLSSIAIPDSVKKIGKRAFIGCSSLSSITIPDGVKKIDYAAFENCKSLSSIRIMGSETIIEKDTFWGCNKVTIHAPEGSHAQSYARTHRMPFVPTARAGQEKKISGKASGEVHSWSRAMRGGDSIPARNKCGENACWELEDGVLTINGNGAMGEYDLKSRPWDNQCDNIKAVVINAGITSIGNKAFWGCNSLSNVTIPASVQKIGSDAFFGCKSLTGITIPDGVREIAPFAFDGCSNLTSITIPASVQKIGLNAFSGCESLTDITIPDGVREIDSSAFNGCSNLTSITIPASVTRISPFAFDGCRRLTIYAPKENCARGYARTHRIPFVPV